MYLGQRRGDADGVRCAAAQGVSRWESRGFVTKRTASPLCSNISNRVFFRKHLGQHLRVERFTTKPSLFGVFDSVAEEETFVF
jgi:hypothetical protein